MIWETDTREPEIVAKWRGHKSGKWKHNYMLAVYGSGPDNERCRDCVHLVRYQMGSTWFKCDLRPITGSVASDHNATWPACGKFEKGE